MNQPNLIRCIHTALILVLSLVWCSPSMAISIKDEEQLAREFLKVVAARFDLIEDPMIVGYVNQVGRKILAQVPPQPFKFRFYVIKENVYNAFAIPAGHIFINSGLLAVMESEDELAGILAHEISHVVHRHISQRIERSKKIDIATLAGVVAGVFLGAAGGNAEAAQALTIGSMAAGTSAYLAYSREDETQADQSGLTYMRNAGYSGEALLSVLKKIRGKQWFGAREIPSYMMTHPALEDRITQLDTDMSVLDRKNAAPSQVAAARSDPFNSGLFKKVNIRLTALYEDPDAAFRHFQAAVSREPENPDQLYGYGLVLARRGNRSEAVTYLREALAIRALDPVVLSDLGRIYFLDGRYADALAMLEGALSVARDNGEGLFYLGRTRMELGRFQAAVDAFEKLLEIYPDYRPVYQFLGETYGRLDRLPEAHFYLGLFHFKKGDYTTARFHLARSQKELVDPAKLEMVNQLLEEIRKTPKLEQRR
jgi:beta-barrel assembly-enhancing protease